MKIDNVKGSSLFTRINPVPRQYPYLTDNIQTEVTIIGGGVTGAIVGYYFSKNNIPCVLIEKGRIGHGSTSITTSLLQYELDSNLTDLLRYTTKEKVLRSYRLGQKALDEVESFANIHGNTFDYMRADSVLYTTKKLEKHEIRSEYETRKDSGFDVQYLESSDNPFGFDLQAAVVSVNGAAKVDPYKFTHALLDAAQSNGLRIYENTEADNLHYQENSVTVTTNYDINITSNIVIAATGYDYSLFTKRNLGETLSTTFNIATKPIPQLAQIYNQHIFRDNNDIYNYFRTTADQRIIMGGCDVGFLPEINNKDLCDQQCHNVELLLKQLFHSYDIEIEYRYYGAFASTNDNLGFIGKDPDHQNIWYCLGYGANGILFAILGGLMLPELYKGNVPKDLHLFNVKRYCK